MNIPYICSEKVDSSYVIQYVQEAMSMPSRKREVRQRKTKKLGFKKVSQEAKRAAKSAGASRKGDETAAARGTRTSPGGLSVLQANHQALREGEEKYRVLFNQARDGIVLVDAETGQIVDCNLEFEKQTGRKLKQLKNMKIWEMRPPEKVAAAKRKFFEIREIRTGGSSGLEFQQPKGKIVPVEFINSEIILRHRKYIQSIVRDITESKQAEEKVKASHEEYRTLVETSSDMIFTVDLKGNFQFTNQAFGKVLGYSAEEIKKMNGFELVHPKDSEIVREQFARLVEGNSVGNMEYRYKTKDGSYISILNNASPIFDPQGNVVAALGAARDITGRKRAEKALQESELWMRNMFNSLEEAVFVVTPDRTLVNINPAAQKMFGYTKSELVDLSTEILHIDHEHYVDFGRRIEEAFDKEETASFEFEAKRKNGEIFPTEHAVSLLKNDMGESLGIVSVVRDISERKRAEEELKQYREHLEELVDERTAELKSANERLKQEIAERKRTQEKLHKRTHELDERVKELNCLFGIASVVQKPGVSLKEILEGTLQLIPPAWRYPEITCARLVLACQVFKTKNFRETSWRQASDIVVRDHPVGTLEVFYLEEKPERDEGPFLAEERSLINAIAERLARITERKKGEQEIQELNESLKVRAAELAAANRELEAFSYSVSHDLRAPLRAVEGFSTALMEDHSDKLDKEGKDYLGRVRVASQHMRQLIDGLLNLSLTIRREMRREETNLSPLVGTIAAELQKTQPERKVEFVIQDGVLAHGDPRLLRDVLENLVGNAWKFTGKHPQAKIEFGLTQKEGQKVYFVRDDGAGFDKAYVDKLFVPFQRLHSTAEFSGNGIGLAVVSWIINRHGGRIWAEGEVEKGTTFYFTLT